MKESFNGTDEINSNNQENSPLVSVFNEELYDNTLKNVPLPEKISNKYVQEIIYKDELRKFCIDNDISENTTELTKEQKQDFKQALKEAQLNYPVKTDNKIDKETEKNLKEQVRTAQEKIDDALDYIILTKLELTTEQLNKEIQNFKNTYINHIFRKIGLIHTDKELQKQQAIKKKTYERQLIKDIVEILGLYDGKIEFIEENGSTSIKEQDKEALTKIISEYFNEKNKEGIDKINEKMNKLQENKDLKKNYEQMINEIDLKDVNDADKDNLMLIASLFLQEQYKMDKSFQLALLYGYQVLLNLKEKILNNTNISFGAKKNIIKTDKINKKKQKGDEKKLTLAVNVKEDENQKPYGIKEQITSALQVALGNNQIKIYTPYIMADCHNRGYITGEELKKEYPVIHADISKEIIKDNERSHNKLQIAKINMDLSKKIRLILTKLTKDDHINNFFYKINKNREMEDIIQFDYDMNIGVSDEIRVKNFKKSEIFRLIYGDEKKDCYYDRLNILYKEYKKIISTNPETIIAILCYRLQKVYGSKLYKNKKKLADAIHKIYNKNLVGFFAKHTIVSDIMGDFSYFKTLFDNPNEEEKKKIEDIEKKQASLEKIIDYKSEEFSSYFDDKDKILSKIEEYLTKSSYKEEENLNEELDEDKIDFIGNEDEEIKEVIEEIAEKIESKEIANDQNKPVHDTEKNDTNIKIDANKTENNHSNQLNNENLIISNNDVHISPHKSKIQLTKIQPIIEQEIETKLNVQNTKTNNNNYPYESEIPPIIKTELNYQKNNIKNTKVETTNLEGADDKKQAGCCAWCSCFNSNK